MLRVRRIGLCAGGTTASKGIPNPAQLYREILTPNDVQRISNQQRVFLTSDDAASLGRCGIGGSCVRRLGSLAPLDSGAADMEQQHHSDVVMKGGAAWYQAYGQQVTVCVFIEQAGAQVHLVLSSTA